MQSKMSRRTLLNYIGIAILIVGMGAGASMFLHAGSSNNDADISDSLYESRVYQRNVEMYSGKFGLIMDQWTRKISNPGNTKPFAIIIILVSTLVAGGCFIAASEMPRN